MFSYYVPHNAPMFNYGPGPMPGGPGLAHSSPPPAAQGTQRGPNHPYVYVAPPHHHPHAMPPPPPPHGFPFPYAPYGPPPMPVSLADLLAQLQQEQDAQEPGEAEEGLFAREPEVSVPPLAPAQPATDLRRKPTIRRKTEEERLAEIEAERARLLARKAEREERERVKAEAERIRVAEAAAKVAQQKERQRKRREAVAMLQRRERERQRAAEAAALAQEEEEEGEEEGPMSWPTLLSELLGLFLGEEDERPIKVPVKQAEAAPIPAATPTGAALAAELAPGLAEAAAKEAVPAPAPMEPAEPAAEPEPPVLATKEGSTPEPVSQSSALHHVQLLLDNFDRLTRAFAFPRVLSFTEAPTEASDLFPHLGFGPQNAPVHTYEQALNAILSELDEIPSSGDPMVRKARRDLVKKVEKELAWLEEEVKRAWEREKASKLPEPEEAAELEMNVAPATEEELEETKAALETFLAPDATVQEQPNVTALEAEALVAAAEAEAGIAPVEIPAPLPAVGPAEEQSQDEQVIVDQKKKEPEIVSLEEEEQMLAAADEANIPEAGVKPPVVPANPPVEVDMQSQDEQVILDQQKKEKEVSEMDEEVQMNAPGGTYEFVEPNASP